MILGLISLIFCANTDLLRSQNSVCHKRLCCAWNNGVAPRRNKVVFIVLHYAQKEEAETLHRVTHDGSLFPFSTFWSEASPCLQGKMLFLNNILQVGVLFPSFLSHHVLFWLASGVLETSVDLHSWLTSE
jgi:hypothetical protein